MGNSGRKGGRPLGRRRTGCAGGAGLSGAGPVCCRKNEHKNRNLHTGNSCFLPAEDGSRTHKVLLPHGPEPCASANSATSAFCFVLLLCSSNEGYYKMSNSDLSILFLNFLSNLIFEKIKKICQKWLPSRKIYAILPFVLRECWNWQTGKTKDLVGVCSCGFKSHLPHFRERNPSKEGSFFAFS